MNSARLFIIAAACATLAVSFDGVAAPAAQGSSCSVPLRQTLVERRISEEAARGLPALISFVNRTQPIYQVRLVDAVEWLDADRERRDACVAMAAAPALD